MPTGQFDRGPGSAWRASMDARRVSIGRPVKAAPPPKPPRPKRPPLTLEERRARYRRYAETHRRKLGMALRGSEEHRQKASGSAKEVHQRRKAGCAPRFTESVPVGTCLACGNPWPDPDQRVCKACMARGDFAVQGVARDHVPRERAPLERPRRRPLELT